MDIPKGYKVIMDIKYSRACPGLLDPVYFSDPGNRRRYASKNFDGCRSVREIFAEHTIRSIPVAYGDRCCNVHIDVR